MEHKDDTKDLIYKIFGDIHEVNLHPAEGRKIEIVARVFRNETVDAVTPRASLTERIKQDCYRCMLHSQARLGNIHA